MDVEDRAPTQRALPPLALPFRDEVTTDVAGERRPVVGTLHASEQVLERCGTRIGVRGEALLATLVGAILHRYTAVDTFEYSVLDCKGMRTVRFECADAETTFAQVAREVEADLSLVSSSERAARNVAVVIGEGYACEADIVVRFTLGPQVRVAIEAEPRVDPRAMARMLGHMNVVLGAVLLDVNVAIATAPLLTGEERRRMLVDWNATRAPFDERALLHELFEAAVRRFPERTALIVGERRFTYDELNTRANQLAHRLIEGGLGPEMLVGVCLERNEHLPIAVLAVMKSGAAYVPLDPANPPARLQLILEDSDVAALLTQATLAPLFPQLAAPILDVPTLEVGAYARENPPQRAESRNAAYVIYTSGSTGRPKGAVIEHRSLSAFIAWTQKAYSEDELAGVLCAASIAFDVSVFELFGPLCAGGCSILVDDILGFHEAPAKSEVRVVSGTASGLSALVSTGPIPVTVTTVMQAGERLHGTLAHALYQFPGVTRVLNFCGATEDTVYSVIYEVDPSTTANPPIGRPFDNHEAYVLDANLQPVPVGVIGELYYAGEGLAREYLKRPALTAERFIPNVIATSPYERLYRSGDLVRLRDDGNLEYVTRVDHQLKIRGFRVEPAEIEVILAAHPSVSEIVVEARSADDGDIMLVAYVVTTAGAALTTQELRAFASQRLPDYMVPSALVTLGAFPLSPTGKIDRKALPVPILQREVSDAFVAARDETERAVQALWREFLGLDAIGVNDDFFALGGHSLMAARIVARLRDRFNVALTLRQFFEAPRIADLAASLKRAETSARVLPGGARDGAVGDALSFAQEHLWFLDRLLPNAAVYNVPLGLRLRGPLDEIALVRALDALVWRHDELRTIFPVFDGRPVARPGPMTSMPLRRESLDDRSSLAERLTAAAREPFDLERGPLVRSLLLRCSESEHVLLISMHHIVSDGWSLNILTSDLARLYEGFCGGREPDLEPIEIRYAEHAAGERAAAEGDLFERDFAYWLERLKALPKVELEGDRIPPRIPSFEGSRLTRRIEGPLYGALRALARASSATTYAVLLAAYASLIARYTNETDIVIGGPMAGRRYPELEGLVGYFISTVALRIDTSGNPTFATLVERARTTVVEALDHQALPVQLLVERLAPDRGGLQSPLFSLAFVMQQAPVLHERGGITFDVLPVSTETAKFDLLLEATEDDNGITCTFEYASDRFDRARVAGFMDAFLQFLEAAAGAQSSPLSTYEWVSSAQRVKLCAAPRPDRSPRSALPLHRWFEARAALRPDAIAVSMGSERVTYGELNRRANRIAHALRALGAQPGAYIGLSVQRSADLAAAILGIAKTGAAYVPLDPQYPAERLAFIANDAQLTAIAVDRASLGATASASAPQLVLDDVSADAGEENLPSDPAPSDPAYVIYTSGSTGTPKGVVVEQRNVARLFTASEGLFDFGEHDVWTLFHSYGFDFSVWEFWGALAYGGRLAIVPAETARAPHEFRRLLAREGVTVLNQTPSAFYELISADAEYPDKLDLRYVIFGGESLEMRRLESWMTRYGDGKPRLVNMYGITETTVHVTFRPLSKRDLGSARAPIGGPLPDLALYLLDEHGRLAPDGAPGEIYVGGAGVARGYLRRDDLTAARFVRNPLDPARGERLYRSGDLARRRPDGTYEYLGRADQQVKIRGFRIELGEIEATLAAHPDVVRAAVLAQRNGAGEARLIAYVVLAEPEAAVDGLRAHLARSLPQYMIPSAFVAVDEMPLTEHGKLDRRALAAHSVALPQTGTHVAPVSSLQRRLARVFEAVLEVNDVGIDDNFFALGGHSLLAARLIARVQRECAAEVQAVASSNGKNPLLALFYVEPTVRALATMLERGRSVESTSIVQLQAGDPSRTPLFWLHGMFNGDGLYTWNVAERLDPAQPVWVIHPHGYDNTPFPADIGQLSREHLALIRSVRPHGPYHIGGFCNGALIAYEIAAQLVAVGESVESLFLVSIPPLVGISPQLQQLAKKIGALFRLDAEGRTKLYLYLYVYAGRIGRFIHGSRRVRAIQFSRGVAKIIGKARSLAQWRSVGTPTPSVSDIDWSDPGVKNDWYLRAIAEHLPAAFPGRIDIVWGRETLAKLEEPSGGWARLAREVRVIAVDGGHFCVVDSAAQVGDALAAALESAPCARASRDASTLAF